MLVRKTASGNAQQRCIGSDMKLGSLWGEAHQRHVLVCQNRSLSSFDFSGAKGAVLKFSHFSCLALLLHESTVTS